MLELAHDIDTDGDADAGDASSNDTNSGDAPFDDAPCGPCVSGHALVVEDDVIIAMDTEDMLLEMGAERVTIAGSVAQALEVVEREAVGFALLDVKLGADTSAPVARALRERGVPFAFATGYGDMSEVSREMPDVPVLRKPYVASTLETAICSLGQE